MLEPKLITVFKEGYSLSTLKDDLIAGLMVGILAIPMTLAFGIASGVTPMVAIWTGVVGGFLAALFTGSRFQISGPTGAFIILVSGIIYQHGLDGLVTATFIAGILLLIMGFSGLGKAVKFIPYPVIIGFTSAIALLIASSQAPDFLGIPKAVVASVTECERADNLFTRLVTLYGNLDKIDPVTCLISILSVFIVVAWPRITTVIPGSLIAVLVTTGLVTYFDLPVATIQSRFGELSLTFPTPQLPPIDFNILPALIQPAIAIALLAGIESLLSAIVADGMTGTRHRSNIELVAQGMGNLGSAIIGGIPVTGAIARTGTSIRAGAKTPVAAVSHCFFVLLLISFLGEFVNSIPVCTLSGIVMVIAYNMSEWRVFRELFLSPRGDVLVLLATFSLTALVDLVTGIEAGVIIAAFMVINRLAEYSHVVGVEEALEDAAPDELEHYRMVHSLPGVELFEISGSFFFAATEKFKSALLRIKDQPKVVILNMSRVMDIDASGLRVLKDLFGELARNGTATVICGLSPRVQTVMGKARLLDKRDHHYVCADLKEGVAKAQKLVG